VNPPELAQPSALAALAEAPLHGYALARRLASEGS